MASLDLQKGRQIKTTANIRYATFGIQWFAFMYSTHLAFLQRATDIRSVKPNVAYPNRWGQLKKTTK